MRPEIFRRYAEQCRRLMLLTRTEAAREQLKIWAEEFDARAEALEREETQRPRAAD